MASLDKFASIAERFGMSESTACDALHDLIHFIHQYLLDKVVVWPTAEESQEIQDLNHYRNYSNISTPLEFRPQSFCQNHNYFFDYLNFDHPNLSKIEVFNHYS